MTLLVTTRPLSATVCHRRTRGCPSYHKPFEKRNSPVFGDACRRALCLHVVGDGGETLCGRDVQIHGLRGPAGVCNGLDVCARQTPALLPTYPAQQTLELRFRPTEPQ